MSLLELLKKDHDEVKALFRQIDRAEASGERGALFRRIEAALLPHAHAEERVLYRPMQKRDGEDARELAIEAAEEHALVETLVTALGRSRTKGSERWHARCKILRELLEHHIEEEESALFDEARRQFARDELERMAERFESEKKQEAETALG